MYERRWSSIKNVPKMNPYFARTPVDRIFTNTLTFSLFLSFSPSLSLSFPFISSFLFFLYHLCKVQYNSTTSICSQYITSISPFFFLLIRFIICYNKGLLFSLFLSLSLSPVLPPSRSPPSRSMKNESYKYYFSKIIV